MLMDRGISAEGGIKRPLHTYIFLQSSISITITIAIAIAIASAITIAIIIISLIILAGSKGTLHQGTTGRVM